MSDDRDDRTEAAARGEMNRYDFPNRCPNCNGSIDAELCDFGGDYVLFSDVEERVKSERARVVRGDFTQICSYCGEEMTEPPQWEKLQDHIQNCNKHPLKIMKDKLWHMEAEINSLKAVGCVNCLELRKALEVLEMAGRAEK